MFRLAIIFLMLIDSLSHIQAAESSREAFINERLAAYATADELLWLMASGEQFIALHNLATNPSGVVLILHDMGSHADWPDIIAPLRALLPPHGWSTLSIQLPVLPLTEPLSRYRDTLPEAYARVEATIAHLHGQQVSNIVLLGYGVGAAIAANYLLTEKDNNLIAFVAISISAQKFFRSEFDTLKKISEIRAPVLDIIAEQDIPEVLSSAEARRINASKNDDRQYQQLIIRGSTHQYFRQEKNLALQISHWLRELPKQCSDRYECFE